MDRLLLVCLGSAAGGGARYLGSTWSLRTLGGGFPWGTLAVNLTGTFLLGAIAFAGLQARALPPALTLALTTGVMGGFTTFSTFGLETLSLLERGAIGLAAAYAIGSVAGGVAACAAGAWATRALLG